MVIRVNGVDLDSSNMQSTDKKQSYENQFITRGKPKKVSSGESYLYILKITEGTEFKIINKETDSINFEYVPSLNELMEKRAMRKKFAER